MTVGYSPDGTAMLAQSMGWGGGEGGGGLALDLDRLMAMIKKELGGGE
jgi:hypothetical protein